MMLIYHINKVKCNHGSGCADICHNYMWLEAALQICRACITKMQLCVQLCSMRKSQENVHGLNSEMAIRTDQWAGKHSSLMYIDLYGKSFSNICHGFDVITFVIFSTVPAISLATSKAVGNVLVGTLNGTMRSGATLVAGQAGNGLYFNDITSRVEYGFYHSHCFHDPDVCSQGFTTALWLKIDQATTKGQLMNTGGDYNTAKGKLHVWLQLSA